MIREKDREVAGKVLDYWFTLEFLAQDKYPETRKLQTEVKQLKIRQSRIKQPEMSQRIRETVRLEEIGELEERSKLKETARLEKKDKPEEAVRLEKTGERSAARGRKSVWDAVSLKSIDSPRRLSDVAASEAAVCGMACWGNLTIYLGKVSREDCICRIGKALPGKEMERPEKSREPIALASLQVTPEGRYRGHSLSLSPMVWALKQIRNCSGRLPDCLDEREYRAVVEGLEEAYFGESAQEEEAPALTTESLKKVFEALRKEYMEDEEFPFDLEESYDMFFQLFADEETRDKEEGEAYSGLSRNFYSRDLKFVMDVLKAQAEIDWQEEGEGMVQDLVRYICGPYHESRGEQGLRMELVHPEGQARKAYPRQLGEILDVRRAPMGKWPSPFMPALMQQIAINLGIHSGTSLFGEPAGRIFSVNGPPGTGKTTLLKEIIVDHVVERAKAMAQYQDPSQAFERREFHHGEKENHAYSKYTRHWYQIKDEKILGYSILVASCNNGAVEKISKELPVSREIPLLLELPLEEDIYFTEYAKALLGQEDAWGLIAAPLGKQANIKSFYYGVVKPLLWDYYQKKEMAQKRIEKYHQARERFLEQWEKVKGLQQEIAALCDSYKEACLARERAEQAAVENKVRIAASLKESEGVRKRLEERQKEVTGKAKEAWAARERAKCEESQRKALEERYQEEEEREKALHRQEWETRKDTGFLTKVFHKEKYKAALQLAEDCRQGSQRQHLLLEELEKERRDSEERKRISREEAEALEKELGQMEQEMEAGRQHLDQLKGAAAELRQEIQETQARAEGCWKEYEAACQRFSNLGEDGGLAMGDGWITDLLSPEEKPSTEAQVSNPWFTKHYNREREGLFYCALQLNREFILSSNYFRDNLITLSQYWGLREGDENERIRFHPKDALEFVPALYQSLFLLVPVLSTTFASVGRLFEDIRRPGVVGTLIVDEAGQAQPQMALGALCRCRRAVVVGDPRQIEPVVTEDLAMLREVFDQEELRPYHSKTLSVQELADQQNGFGTYLDNGTDWPEWMGCPLLVHRRCISPMYDISNAVSYQNMMKQQTRPPKAELCRQFIYEKSQWIQVEGRERGKKDHFVEAQGRKVCEMLEIAFQRNENPSLFIISPFTSVVSGMREYLKKYCQGHGGSAIQAGLPEWAQRNIGTVHTFQGKEANEVIFLLGCDREKDARGAVGWVNRNIVNVAATRAKFRLYVVGDAIAWKDSECVSMAKGILDTFAIREIQSILKEEMSQEEKQAALKEASKGLPSVTSFSVEEQGEEDGERDWSVDTQGLILSLRKELGEMELTGEELEEFGFSSRKEFRRLAGEVQDNLRLGIKLFALLRPVYEVNPRLDASCCAILFCKALEVQMRECFWNSLSALLPEVTVRERGKSVPLRQASREKMMLGGFSYIIRTRQAELGRQMEQQGDRNHNILWWKAFGRKMDQCCRRRNQCCHAGRFGWEDQLSLLAGLFREDFAGSPDERRDALVGGLMFECQVGKCLVTAHRLSREAFDPRGPMPVSESHR